MRTANGQITVVDMNDGESELYINLSSSFGTLPMDTDGVALSDLNQYNITAEIYYGTKVQSITKAEAKTIDSDVWIENVKPSTDGAYPLVASEDGKSISCVVEVGGASWANDNPWVDIALQCAKGTATARFNIFGQRAGNTGASVKVQYSTDTLSWHSTFADGDVWMRVSSLDGTWGSPIRVVGEKGDGGAWTDYSYNISSQLTTSSVSTAPSDITVWYDAPISTTASKPYLWMRVQKYSDTNTIDGAPTYLRITGEKGADGTSVNIKGYVAGYAKTAADIKTNHELTQWAIDEPHGLYVPFAEKLTTVSDGEGYLVKADAQDEPSGYEGHLLVSSGGTWLDCGKITGEKGDDGRTMYLHIAYANSADGSKDFTTDNDGGKTRSFIGTYTDFTQADSTNYKKYYWKPYGGESALYISITPEGDTFPADADGRAEKSSEHTVTARLYYGTVAQEDWAAEVCTADDADWYTAETLKNMSGDIAVNSIRKSGADCVVSYTVGESNWVDDNAYIIIRLKNKYGTVERQVNCFALKKGEKGEDATYIEVSPSNLILEQELSDSLAQSSNNYNVNLINAKFKVYQVTADIRTDITSSVLTDYDDSIFTLSLVNGYQKITKIKSLSKNTEITVSYGNLSVILPIYINTVGTWAQNIKGDTMEAVSHKEWTAVDDDGVLRYFTMESLVKQTADGLLAKAYKTIEVKTVNNSISVKNNQLSYTEYSLTTAADSNIKVLLNIELQSSGENGFLSICLTGKKEDATEWVSTSLVVTRGGQQDCSFSDEVIRLSDVNLRFLCRNCTATVTVLRISQGLTSYIKQTAESMTIDAANVYINNGGNLAALFQGGNLLLNKAFACPRLSDGTYATSNPTVSIDGDTGLFICHNGVFDGAIQASTIGYAMSMVSIDRNHVTNKNYPFTIDGDSDTVEEAAIVSCLTAGTSIYYLNSNRLPIIDDASNAGDLADWAIENIIWALPHAETVGNRMLDLYFDAINLSLQSNAYQVYLAIGDVDKSKNIAIKDGIYVPSDSAQIINVDWANPSDNASCIYNKSLYNVGGSSSSYFYYLIPLRSVANGKYGQLPRHMRLASLNHDGRWNWYIMNLE